MRTKNEERETKENKSEKEGNLGVKERTERERRPGLPCNEGRGVGVGGYDNKVAIEKENERHVGRVGERERGIFFILFSFLMYVFISISIREIVEAIQQTRL